MGSSQSTATTQQAIGLYVRNKTPTGAYDYHPVSASQLSHDFLAQNEMTPLHQKLLNEKNITQVELFERNSAGQYVPSTRVYYRNSGPVLEEAQKAVAEYWKMTALPKILTILKSAGIANSLEMADEILKQACKQGFELTTEVTREKVAGIMQKILPTLAEKTRIDLIDVIYTSYVELYQRIFGAVKAPTTGGEVAPMMGGLYGKLVGSSRMGGAEEGESDKMAIVKTAFLDRLAKNKEQLVEQLLGIFKNMPYPEFKNVTGTPAERLRKIADFIAKHPASKADSISEKVVKAINETFGVMVIDPALPVDIRVTQLEETLKALSHGICSDFFLIGMDINRDVMNIMKLVKALTVWRDALKENYSKRGATIEAERLLTPLDTIIREFDRYVMLIKASLSQHYEGTLTGLLMSTDKESRRSSSLSDRVSGILSGIVSTTANALSISSALDKIGMPLEEFKKIGDGREFFARFANLITDDMLRESDDPEEFFTAARIIFQGLGQKEVILDAIEEARKRKGASIGGGAPISQPEKLAIKTFDARKKRLAMITNSYGLSIQNGLRKIREAIDNFAGAIGKDVPIGNLLSNFVDLLRQLIDIKLEQPKIHLALLGYFRDAGSKEARDRMLGTLKSVAAYAEFIAKDPQYSKSKIYFEAIRGAIDELIASIDQASDSIKTMIVGGDVEESDFMGSGIAGGGVDGGIDGGDDNDSSPMRVTIRDLVVRDKLKLVDSVEKADYMVRVAQLKGNLSRMVETFKTNTESYDDRVLGPAVAARIAKIKAGQAHTMKAIKEGLQPAQGTAFEPVAVPGGVGDAEYDYIVVKDANKERAERVETFFNEYYNALIGFWESAQAIELYLKYFTNALVSNPGAISDLAMMIREVEVITEMYNETTGNMMAQIFEKNFPSNKDLGSHLMPPAGAKPSPVDTTGANYFDWNGVGAMPFTQVMKNRIGVMIEDARRGLEQYTALKNLVSFFVHFGSQLGGQELRRVALRTPAEIYHGLVRFMAVSSFAAGFRRNTDTRAAGNMATLTYKADDGQFSVHHGARGGDADYNPGGGVIAAPANGTAIPAGGSGHADQVNFGCGRNQALSDCVFMRPYQQNLKGPADEMTIFDTETALDLAIENQAFAAIIKALGAKVLVLSGMYDLIDRPHEQHESRASIRMILGAGPGDEAPPKVDEAITELYVRLPLLALFYKRHFSSNTPNVGTYMKDEAKIMLLPDLSGSVFSDFISHIFKKFPHVDTQFFTDYEMRILITEINIIHEKLASKFPTDTCRSILQEFVQVMSKMIYIIGASDQTDYTEKTRMDSSFRYAFREGREESGEITDIDILGEEGFEDEMIKRPMPADRAATLSQMPMPVVKTPDYTVKAEHWNLVRKFRCMIDKELAKPSITSLRGSIVAAQVKLGQTSDVSDRFKLVCGLVRGTGGITTIDNLRRMIFLEIMGTGLGILSAIYSTVRQFQIAVTVSNPETVVKAMSGLAANAVDNDEIAAKTAEQLAIILNIKDEKGDTQAVIEHALMVTMGYITKDKRQYTKNATEVDSTQMSFDLAAHVVKFGGAGNFDIQNKDDKSSLENHCIFYPAAMATLLESIATLISHTHEFVRVDIADGSLLVDFGVLQNYVKKFLGTMGQFVDKMRPHIDPETIRRYTQKEIPGSLYWLQEQFVEKLTEGRRAGAIKDGDEYSTFTHLTHEVKNAFKRLTEPITHDINNTKIASYHVDYARTMAHLIAHNGSQFINPANSVPLFRDAEVLANPFDAVLIRGSAGEKTVDTRFLWSLAMTSENEVYEDMNNSILFSFNKLLAMFLRQMYDSSTGKIFSGLINTFAQGAFNSAILTEANTFPDHLAHYYVLRGKPGTVATQGPASIGPAPQKDIDTELSKYLKFLDHLGLEKSHQVFGYDKDGKINPYDPPSTKSQTYYTVPGGQIHRFVAGLLLAWFAEQSNFLTPENKYKDDPSVGQLGDFGPNKLYKDIAQGAQLPIDQLTILSEQLRAAMTIDDSFEVTSTFTTEVEAVATASSATPTIPSTNTIVKDISAAAVLQARSANKKLYTQDPSGFEKMSVYLRSVFSTEGKKTLTEYQNMSKVGGTMAFQTDVTAIPNITLDEKSLWGYFGAISLALARAQITPEVKIRTRNAFQILDMKTQPEPPSNPSPDTFKTVQAHVHEARDLIYGIFQELIQSMKCHAWMNITSPSMLEHALYVPGFGTHQGAYAEFQIAHRDFGLGLINEYGVIPTDVWQDAVDPLIEKSPLKTNLDINMAVAVQVGFKLMYPEIIPMKGSTCGSESILNTLTFLANAYGGIYNDEIGQQIAQVLQKQDKLIQQNPWIAALAYPMSTPSQRTPQSQVIARGHILNTLMKGLLSVPVTGSPIQAERPDGMKLSITPCIGTDLLTRTRSSTCLALYTSLMTDMYFPETRVNVGHSVVAICACPTQSTIKARLTSLQQVTPIVRDFPIDPVEKEGDINKRVPMAIQNASQQFRKFGNSTIHSPTMGSTFAQFLVQLFTRDSDLLKSLFTPSFITNSIVQALVTAVQQQYQSQTKGFDYFKDLPTTTFIMNRLLHGGMIFNRSYHDSLIEEINSISYAYALFAPVWFLPVGSTSIDSTALTDEWYDIVQQMIREQFLAISRQTYDLWLAVGGQKLKLDEYRTSLSKGPKSIQDIEKVIGTYDGLPQINSLIKGTAEMQALSDDLNILGETLKFLMQSRPNTKDPGGLQSILIANDRIGMNAIFVKLRELHGFLEKLDDPAKQGNLLGQYRACLKALARNLLDQFDAISTAGKDKINSFEFMTTLLASPQMITLGTTKADRIKFFITPTVKSGLPLFGMGESGWDSTKFRVKLPGDISYASPFDNMTRPSDIKKIPPQYFDQKLMVSLIRAAHDLFIQLNMMADLHYAYETAKTVVSPAKLLDSLSTAFSEHVTAMIAGFADSSRASHLKGDNVLIHGIFDGVLPTDQRYFIQKEQPAIILAHAVKQATSGQDQAHLILNKRAQISTQEAQLATAIAGAYGKSANEKDIQDIMTILDGIKQTGVSLKVVKAFVGPPANIIKHIITIKELRMASKEMLNDRDGAYILYPGDQLIVPTLWTELKNYHARLHIVDPSAITLITDFINRKDFESRVIPNGQHVLFASLGHILNNILTTTDERTQLRVHLLESAADIPSYLREKYRAQIPFFRAAFDSLTQKCEFYKRIMENMVPECFRTTSKDLPLGFSRDFAKIGYKFGDTSVSEKLIGILKTVATGSSALVQDCSRALTDVGDQPRYFEVSQDSINAYRAQNNGDPIMPLSALLRPVRVKPWDQKTEWGTNKLDDALYPRYGFGDPAFKYQYAIRGLYHRMGKEKDSEKPLQLLAALDSMVSLFNKFSHGGIKIDAGLSGDIAQGFISGFDFLHDVKRIKRFISATTNAAVSNATAIAMPMTVSIIRPKARATDTSNKVIRILSDVVVHVTDKLLPTPIGLSVKDVGDVVGIVENRSREDAIRAVVSGTLGAADTRGDAIAANIVDMNIIPFDLHVLARQMPLHFIWNYAFTFDAIAGAMLYDKMQPSKIMDEYFSDCRPKSTTQQIDLVPILTARDALFAMIAEPYRTFTRAEKDWLDRMLIGATGVPNFARPKFLSDQIAGKILLGHVLRGTQPEVGPPSQSFAITLLNGSDLSTDKAEASIYESILTEYGRRLLLEQTVIVSAIQRELQNVAPILMHTRPIIDPITLTDDQYRAFVAISITNDLKGGKLAPGRKEDLIAAVDGNQDAKDIAEEYDKTRKRYLHRGIAAIMLYTSMSLSAGKGPAVANIWKDVISKWNPGFVTGLTNEHKVAVGNGRVTVSPIKSLAYTDTPQEYAPVTDEYGNMTFSQAPSIPKARVIHDMRADTLLVRNLIHIGLVLSIVQMRLEGDMTYMRDRRVVESMSAINPAIYKFFGNQTQSEFGQRVTYPRAQKKYI